MAIERGTIVEAVTASGETLAMRALGGPIQGHDFPVLWVCTEQEWARSAAAHDDADGLPWPVEAIKELQRA